MDTQYQDDDDVVPYRGGADAVPSHLYSLEGGPPARPKPLYNDGLVLSIAALVDSGARLLEADGRGGLEEERDTLWHLVTEGRRLVDREIKRRRDKNKLAKGR